MDAGYPRRNISWSGAALPRGRGLRSGECIAAFLCLPMAIDGYYSVQEMASICWRAIFFTLTAGTWCTRYNYSSRLSNIFVGGGRKIGIAGSLMPGRVRIFRSRNKQVLGVSHEVHDADAPFVLVVPVIYIYIYMYIHMLEELHFCAT